MKKLLQNKPYSCMPLAMAFIVTAIMFSASAKAQIVYTDVTPDSTFTITSWVSHTYNLDLDGDGTTDFLIKAARIRPIQIGGTYSSYVSITPQGSNAFISTALNTVKKLVLGDTISLNQAWHVSTIQYLKKYQQTGNLNVIITGDWNNVVDGHVGLQLINGGQTYYGWVRMDVNVSMTSPSMTIKDYAYNTIPNQPILAGNTGSGMTGITENSFASSINIFPNPATNLLTIDLGSNSKKVEVTISDITGKTIYKNIAQEAQKIEVNTEDFKSGVYVMQIQTADYIGTKRLVVEK